MSEGLIIAVGECFLCERIFNFNPATVPSYDPSHDDPTASPGRRPICASCIEVVNTKRTQAGLAPWPVEADSYSPASPSVLDQ